MAPHIQNAVTECLEAFRLCLGPSVVLNYLLQGLFHPARKVREAYWRVIFDLINFLELQ